MDQRGRKGESQRVVAFPGNTVPGALPEPPEALSEAEKAVWRQVVETKPASWFTPDIYPLLADYCTATVQQEGLRAIVNECTDPKERATVGLKLLSAFDKLGKLKMALATKMRLTQQSRYTPQAAATAAKQASGKRPWEE